LEHILNENLSSYLRKKKRYTVDLKKEKQDWTFNVMDKFEYGSESSQQFGNMQLNPMRIWTTGKVFAGVPVVLGHGEPRLRFHQPLFHLQIE
jgi:hypothetical protein